MFFSSELYFRKMLRKILLIIVEIELENHVEENLRELERLLKMINNIDERQSTY